MFHKIENIMGMWFFNIIGIKIIGFEIENIIGIFS
jgi:hypothetical protein